MTRQGLVRRVFPGGNTYKGFYSYYDNILRHDEANRIIILKGGPGVGKSSFMKKLGRAMERRGYTVEYHHCSSDNNSLDGVLFPQKGVLVVDGTAPHVIDPKFPGVIDEIINLGEFWKVDKLTENREKIVEINLENKRHFKRAYKYLRAAKEVYDNIQSNIEDSTDYVTFNNIVEDMVNEIFKGSFKVKGKGKERLLFGSAITPAGIIDHLDTVIIPNEEIYVLYGKYDFIQSGIIEKIASIARYMGYSIEFFHNHLIPEKTDHIVIKDLSVAITIKDFRTIASKTYDVEECIRKDILNSRENEVKQDLEYFEALLKKGVESIANAKSNHDLLEEYYISAVDYNKIDELLEKTLNRILSY